MERIPVFHGFKRPSLVTFWFFGTGIFELLTISKRKIDETIHVPHDFFPVPFPHDANS